MSRDVVTQEELQAVMTAFSSRITLLEAQVEDLTKAAKITNESMGMVAQAMRHCAMMTNRRIGT
ncbi:MAG: hypothetical protein GY838_13540 [bacterium]|nr:hypothetical protein [bacterium]